MEKLEVHIHHRPRDKDESDCLGSNEISPGEAIGGDLAGGLFYVGLDSDGTLIITFEDTCHPEDIRVGEFHLPEGES